MQSLDIIAGELSLEQLQQVYRQPTRLVLDAASRQRVAASVQVVAAILAQDRAVYGINTGFGLLARERIADDQLQDLQRRLVLSHACGTGELLSDAQVRLIMALKINSLARGYSGIRQQVIDALIALSDGEVYPCIPGKGSVGASGDLAPLAHLEPGGRPGQRR